MTEHETGGRRALPGEGTGMSGVEELAEQLAVAVEALEEILVIHEDTARHPDDDAALDAVAQIAGTALAAVRGQ